MSGDCVEWQPLGSQRLGWLRAAACASFSVTRHPLSEVAFWPIGWVHYRPFTGVPVGWTSIPLNGWF